MAEILYVSKDDISLTELYCMVSKEMDSKAFYEALSALYAIGKIEMSKNGRITKC